VASNAGAAPAIRVEGLTKRFKDVVAVDGLDLEVEEGALFAFVGTNGAGKSTAINCMTTLLDFDAGALTVAGHDVGAAPEAVRREIGVVFQTSVLDPALSVRENLAVKGALSGLPAPQLRLRAGELAELIDFEDYLGRRYKTLSGGQQRRVDIARALLHRPRVLFLDEPTAGLDPASRIAVWATIRRLREQEGLTVFLTTHYLEETEEADEVTVVDRGRVIATGTPTALRAEHSESVLSVRSADRAALLVLAARLGAAAQEEADAVRIVVPDAAAARAILAEHGDAVLDFEFRHGRMDDVFLRLTGREAVDE